MTEKVYIVYEDKLDGKTKLRRAFSNEEAADSYVEDPDQLGNLYVGSLRVESEYSG